MPATSVDFLGQGTTNSSATQTGDPPGMTGAVGPSDYVQAVNGGIEIWNKSGTVVQASKSLVSLWSGYVGTNAGNGCSSRNDGEPIVQYDRMADRWLIAQFSLPNPSVDSGPSFECVAVSKTADPAGAYHLYDFKFPYAINDSARIGVWPDAYYLTFNAFGASTLKGVDVCAWNRTAMLAGQAFAPQCFFQAAPTEPACPAAQAFMPYGVVPATLDGSVPPPTGAPEYLMQADMSQCSGPYNQLDLWKLHIDWATPANSTLSSPTVLTVPNFLPACYAANFGPPNCIPQPGTTTTLDALADHLMDRLVYRNFGGHESVVLNHTVQAGAGAGLRWYEVRDLSGSPSVFQTGTYAPPDANWRWLGSLAEDQAGDLALGFSASSGSGGVAHPSIGWTGRLASDPTGTMGQAETILDVGAANAPTVGSGRAPWGLYSSMTVDPSDDCTFWYTNELYKSTTSKGWDTRIASVKFPGCGANDFSLSARSGVSAAPGSGGNTMIDTGLTKGAAQSVSLYAQDLPPGATASFNPASLPAGQSSTLTLTAGGSTPPGTYTVRVIGTAPSAVHYTTVSFTVSPPPAPVCRAVSKGSDPNTAVPVTFDCSTVNGVPKTYAVVSNPGHGTLSGLDTVNGTVTYTPDLGYLGADSFTYKATDSGGDSNVATVTITVADTSAPTISITAPAGGATYAAGQIVPASYSCSDPDGASNLASCSGPVGSGTPIDTASPGLHSFTVSASDVAGNHVTQTVQYSVSARAGGGGGGGGGGGASGGGGGSAPKFQTSGTPSVSVRGTAIVIDPGITVSCPPGGDGCSADVSATARVPASTARGRAKTIVIGRAHVSISAGGHTRLTFKLSSQGARALRKLRRLRMTVLVVSRLGHHPPISVTKTITIRAPAFKHHHH